MWQRCPSGISTTRHKKVIRSAHSRWIWRDHETWMCSRSGVARECHRSVYNDSHGLYRAAESRMLQSDTRRVCRDRDGRHDPLLYVSNPVTGRRWCARWAWGLFLLVGACQPPPSEAAQSGQILAIVHYAAVVDTFKITSPA